MRLLTGQPALFWVSSYMSLWSTILFNSVVLMNCIVAFFYPFDMKVPGTFIRNTLLYPLSINYLCVAKLLPELNSHMSMLIWAIMLTSLAIVVTLPRESGIRTLVASVILRFIFSMGPEPTLWLLGSVTVLLKGIHIVSLMGNHGTLEKHFLSIITDAQLLYHLCYMLFCLSGILVHPFFYSILVRASGLASGKLKRKPMLKTRFHFSYLTLSTEKKHCSMLYDR